MHPDEPGSAITPPPPPKQPDAETSDGSSEGNLDLDDEDGINNQHLEIR
jgi:hypothetical protein